MKIGDLFWAFRGNGTQLQADAKKEGTKAGTTMGASMASTFKKSWSGSQIGKGLVAGLGLAGGLGAVTLITSAIAKFTDVVGDANAAALAEEVSIQKLDTALRANVEGYDGNTDAIERVLKARMALGFSDDEQRESLARLVIATKDENKALQIQRVAMDLARLKRVDLATASEALIKVEAGQFRALKALGIILPKNATATEALAAVQKAAAGQAEDYAETNEGKLLVSQVKIGESLETLGAVTLPVLVEIMGEAAEIATDLSDAFSGMGEQVKNNEDPLQNFANLVHDLFKSPEEDSRTFFGAIFDGLNDVQSALSDAAVSINDWWTFWDDHSSRADREAAKTADHTADSIEGMKSRAVKDLGTTADAIDGVAIESGDMADDVETANEKAINSWEKLKKDLVASANEIIDEAFDPIITADRLAAVQAELAAQRRILASSKSTKAEKADARSKIHELKKDNAEYLLALAEAGQTGTAAYAKGIKELKTAIKNAKGPARAALQAVLDKILEVERAGKTVPVNIDVSVAIKNAAGGQGRHRAEGGPVRAGVPYVVGERRAELFVPDQDGTILPHVPSAQPAAASSSTPMSITVALPTTARPDPFEVADRLRWLNDFGVLSAPTVPR